MHLPQLPQPNPLTTICIYIAGIFIAIQEATRPAADGTTPDWFPNLTIGAWNYLPLIVLVLGGLVWLYRGLRDARPAARPVAVPTSPQRAQNRLTHATPAPSKPAPPATEDRDFIENTTFPKIVARLAGKTDLQKQALAKPYIGKWMRSRGTFRDVTSTRKEQWLAFIEIDGESIAFLFDNDWLSQLSAIGVGDEVVIDGKIKSLTHGARFDQCELVDVASACPNRSPALI